MHSKGSGRSNMREPSGKSEKTVNFVSKGKLGEGRGVSPTFFAASRSGLRFDARLQAPFVSRGGISFERRISWQSCRGSVVEVYMNECSQLQGLQAVNIRKIHLRYDGAM